MCLLVRQFVIPYVCITKVRNLQIIAIVEHKGIELWQNKLQFWLLIR